MNFFCNPMVNNSVQGAGYTRPLGGTVPPKPC